MKKSNEQAKHTLTVKDKKGKTTGKAVFYQDVKTGILLNSKGKEVKEVSLT